MFCILLRVFKRYEVIHMYVLYTVGVFNRYEVIYMYVLYIVASV